MRQRIQFFHAGKRHEAELLLQVSPTEALVEFVQGNQRYEITLKAKNNWSFLKPEKPAKKASPSNGIRILSNGKCLNPIHNRKAIGPIEGDRRQMPGYKMPKATKEQVKEAFAKQSGAIHNGLKDYGQKLSVYGQ